MLRRHLLLLIAAASPALAQEPAEEKAPTTLDAERIEGVGDLEFSAHGAAELRQEGMTIFAERLRFNQELGRVDADGGVRLQQGVDRFFGPKLQYDTLGDTGVFEQPGFLLQRESMARGGAEQVEFLGRERYRLKNARYTT